ncbi:GreA/GreB family elongation factor [Flavobacteriaceae bacterium KMM 6897]|nr:GreA/GreB family elongation factor [Flavobacteriaceae bacterium KMM 6897]MEB8345402.1 GreA/GreB family elongation factor [Flavobacteriaceae bacterium KMM 6898]
MSRAFVKEDDQEEIPKISPRAHLPAGETNHVTPIGLQNLLDERELLLEERRKVDIDDANERRIALLVLNGKLQLLNDRIHSARPIDLGSQEKESVRFGAKVLLKINGTEKLQTLQIVGVDEADISKGKIAFTAPLAKILNHKKVGEKATLKLENGDRVFEILKIEYP